MLNSYCGTAFQSPLAGPDMIPALDPELRNKRLQESHLWRDDNPSSFNRDFARGSLRHHHLAFILDLAGDYLLSPEETTSCICEVHLP